MNNTKDLGILALNISNTKETLELINLAKTYYSHHPYDQTCFFNSFSEVINSENIPILHISQAKFFYGNLLTTDIESLILCHSFPNINKILFWSQNIPWQQDLKNYKDWEKLFYNDKVQILAKNQEIYDIYDICYKKPQGIAERLNYEQIEQSLR